MTSERPRAHRYPFITPATLTEIESGLQTQQTLCDLSLFGCQIIPGNSTPVGTRIRIQIIHNGESFEALGRVVHVRAVRGVGIVFTRVEDHCQLVLDKWIEALRDKEMAGRIVGS